MLLLLLLCLLVLCCVCCCSNEALHVLDHELQMFLRTLHKQLETVALHPSPAFMVSGSKQQGNVRSIHIDKQQQLLHS
jgi:uncharacterized protein YcfL